VHALLRDTSGRAEYKYPNGELSIVDVDMSGLGTTRTRVANLHTWVRKYNSPVPSIIWISAKQTCTRRDWDKVYRYPVSNGVTAGCDEFDPNPAGTYDHG